MRRSRGSTRTCAARPVCSPSTRSRSRCRATVVGGATRRLAAARDHDPRGTCTPTAASRPTRRRAPSAPDALPLRPGRPDAVGRRHRHAHRRRARQPRARSARRRARVHERRAHGGARARRPGARPTIHVGSTLDHVDVFVRVCDVHPDGTSMNVCDGLQRFTPDTIERDADGVFVPASTSGRPRTVSRRPPGARPGEQRRAPRLRAQPRHRRVPSHQHRPRPQRHHHPPRSLAPLSPWHCPTRSETDPETGPPGGCATGLLACAAALARTCARSAPDDERLRRDALGRTHEPRTTLLPKESARGSAAGRPSSPRPPRRDSLGPHDRASRRDADDLVTARRCTQPEARGPRAVSPTCHADTATGSSLRVAVEPCRGRAQCSRVPFRGFPPGNETTGLPPGGVGPVSLWLPAGSSDQFVACGSMPPRVWFDSARL